jgi:ABC-type lipoprotein release transport system permease subunit
MRTLLSVIGVGIGMTMVVLVHAMGEGLVSAFSTLAGGMGAQLVGMKAGAAIDLGTLDQGIVRRIAALSGVRAVEGAYFACLGVENSPCFYAFGYPPRGQSIRGYPIVEGRPLTGNRQMILGRMAADSLGKGIGDSLRLFRSSFEIVGIYETGLPMQDGGAVISLRDAQRLFGRPHQVCFVNIWVEDVGQASRLRQQILERHPGVRIVQASDFVEDLVGVRIVEDSTAIIGWVVFVLCGIEIANAMTMSVFERTREIGILKALGWRKQRILGMVLCESTAQVLLGGVAGAAGAVVLGWVLSKAPGKPGFLDFEYDASLFAEALLTTVALGVAGGLFPALRAAGLPPVEALRYE